MRKVCLSLCRGKQNDWENNNGILIPRPQGTADERDNTKPLNNKEKSTTHEQRRTITGPHNTEDPTCRHTQERAQAERQRHRRTDQWKDTRW